MCLTLNGLAAAYVLILSSHYWEKNSLNDTAPGHSILYCSK